MPDYKNLWDSMIIDPSRVAEILTIRSEIETNKQRYQSVCDTVNKAMPWYVVAVIHYRESDLDFNTHLANGDPLTQRTTHVPAGLPATGEPPFTWEQGAISALQYDGFDKITDWGLEGILGACERYNGTGYIKYHPNVNSPYLWAATNLYTVGKYGDDGKFDATLVDKQLGCAPLIHYLVYWGVI